MPRQQYCETNSIECALLRGGSPQPVRPPTFSRGYAQSGRYGFNAPLLTSSAAICAFRSIQNS
jgi:hypothetical protein